MSEAALIWQAPRGTFMVSGESFLGDEKRRGESLADDVAPNRGGLGWGVPKAAVAVRLSGAVVPVSGSVAGRRSSG